MDARESATLLDWGVPIPPPLSAPHGLDVRSRHQCPLEFTKSDVDGGRGVITGLDWTIVVDECRLININSIDGNIVIVIVIKIKFTST